MEKVGFGAALPSVLAPPKQITVRARVLTLKCRGTAAWVKTAANRLQSTPLRYEDCFQIFYNSIEQEEEEGYNHSKSAPQVTLLGSLI